MPLPANYNGYGRLNSRKNRPIGPSFLIHQQWVNPLAAVTNGISAIAAAPNTATADRTIGGSLASGGRVVLDFPRPVLVTVTHATSIVAVSGITYGYDLDGQAIQEAWSVTATGTSKTAGGLVSFKVVTRVSVTAAADASADSIIVGTTAKLGLDVTAAHPSPNKELMDGSVPTAGVITIASVAANADPRGIFAPNTAPDGAHDYDVWYISDDPWNS